MSRPLVKKLKERNFTNTNISHATILPNKDVVISEQEICPVIYYHLKNFLIVFKKSFSQHFCF